MAQGKRKAFIVDLWNTFWIWKAIPQTGWVEAFTSALAEVRKRRGDPS